MNANTSSKLAFSTLAFCTANKTSPSFTPAAAAEPSESTFVATYLLVIHLVRVQFLMVVVLTLGSVDHL